MKKNSNTREEIVEVSWELCWILHNKVKARKAIYDYREATKKLAELRSEHQGGLYRFVLLEVTKVLKDAGKESNNISQ